MPESEGNSPERSRRLLPSEEMFTQARRAQERVRDYSLECDFASLDAFAKIECEELNGAADAAGLTGEKMSVEVGRIVLVGNVHQKYESQQVESQRPDAIDRLEEFHGQFAGYGYYIAPRDGGYACTLGAKIIAEYDRTLPFSDTAAVAFCPVGQSWPEFYREQKDHQLEDVRAELRAALGAVDWQAAEKLSAVDVAYAIADIDRLMTNRTIEDVDFLNNLSLVVPLLLKQLESMPGSEVIVQHLVDLLSIQLELPQKLQVSARKYRSPIGTSSGWMVSVDPTGQPRQLSGFEAHLVIAPAAQRSDLFLIGMHEERATQIALSDIIAIEATRK